MNCEKLAWVSAWPGCCSDNYDNDVAATTRGRGAAQAGQINIAVAPNSGAAVGDVKAIAVQGPATAGAFTLTNGQEEVYQGTTVDARTAEYDAVAVNVGVSQAAEMSDIANSAVAETTTGSALAVLEANSAVAKQNSAIGSSDASTTTGQAAGIAATQSVGGVFAETKHQALGRAWKAMHYHSAAVSQEQFLTQDLWLRQTQRPSQARLLAAAGLVGDLQTAMQTLHQVLPPPLGMQQAKHRAGLWEHCRARLL